MYGLAKEGARAREYEDALLWLKDSGMIRKVGRVSGGRLPLKAYEDLKAHAQSLKVFCKKYEPKIAIRTSLKDFKINNEIWNVPLYELWNLKKILN